MTISLAGMKHTPEYRAWRNMRMRCYAHSYAGFAGYGGRGIEVCERWRFSFRTFLADMGKRPSEAHSLDRIDVNGNYEPSNCRWATLCEQMSNRRSNRLIEFRGETKTLTQWARLVGIRVDTLWQRMACGWPVDEALSTPTRAWRKIA